MPELWQLSANAIAEQYRTGALSPVEVVNSVLERIDEVNSRVNAVVSLDVTGAKAAAKESEYRWLKGKGLSLLDGVPITVKDNILVRGLPATWGSKLYQDFLPATDELPINRLRGRGAIVIGKTNCPEFTLQGYTDNLLFGPTRNPWDLELTPGGSSGGAVAAVASGFGPLAIGTDGGGSIRRPASHAGLIGLKPSRGCIPRCDGFPVILHDFEVVGPMARNVTDVVLTMEIMSGPDPRDPRSLDRPQPNLSAASMTPRRILYVRQFGESPVDTEIDQSVARAARVLADLGHHVQEGQLPIDLDAVNQAWPVFSQVGLAWLLRSHKDWHGQVTPAIEEMATAGLSRSGTEYYAALSAVSNLQRALAEFFRQFDLILTPAAAALPWLASQTHPTTIAGQPVGPRGHAVFTAFANMAGCPGISIPAERSARGLPIGFQLVGALGDDDLLCALAAQFEKVCPWAEDWPSV
jgi:aspartyl-tRNA(Asn)/glutamyl-tRNA(Gln) amidotransferase subunit A